MLNGCQSRAALTYECVLLRLRMLLFITLLYIVAVFIYVGYIDLRLGMLELFETPFYKDVEFEIIIEI